MGASKRRNRKFLQAHPRCAFCAGKALATTIEHCPPRALFQFRQWPEGFEFPSCKSCNGGTRDHDLLIAMLARIDPLEQKGDRDGRQVHLINSVSQRFPGIFEKMMLSASEARHQNRELGLRPAHGQTHQEVGVVNIPDELHQAVCVLAQKLVKGIFYRETGTPFPDEGCLLLNWFTNVDLFRDGTYVVFDILKEMGGKAPPLQRSGKYLNDQFEYKLSLSPEKHILALQAKFGNAFGLVVFGSVAPGMLEAIVTRLREQSQDKGPFAILQSPSLVNA